MNLQPNTMARLAGIAAVLVCLVFGGGAQGKEITLSDAEIENLVRRSYQYVAMYNVNNKFALKQGGWNTCVADTQLKDHTMREIARPNNDTLALSCGSTSRIWKSLRHGQHLKRRNCNHD
jgi:hypothetical protein